MKQSGQIICPLFYAICYSNLLRPDTLHGKYNNKKRAQFFFFLDATIHEIALTTQDLLTWKSKNLRSNKSQPHQTIS